MKLTDALISSPVMRAPGSKRPFELHTDLAKTGLGAVLSQRDDEKNEDIIDSKVEELAKGVGISQFWTCANAT